MLVHLTPEKNVRRMLKAGIRLGRARLPAGRGVHAMPVTRSFYVSHQWLRELKRAGQRTLVGVYFRLPDDEEVWIGHYNSEHVRMTADEAMGVVLGQENAEGYEVIVPRRIDADEIHRTRRLPQVLGWRYFPQAHARRWQCFCAVCCPAGTIRARKKRTKWEAQQ